MHELEGITFDDLLNVDFSDMERELSSLDFDLMSGASMEMPDVFQCTKTRGVSDDQ